jgi:DNA (cytosine-5)-methyltransferase 1
MRDLSYNEIMKLKHLDLFSGIGGFSLGLEATGGFETKAFCDIEKYPRQVLQKHWPHVKQYEDIKELNYERLKADGIDSIDIITGGYPCQPFSIAGRQKCEQDPRHLWPEYFRLVKELRPTWVIGENVSGHIKLGLDTVIEDLESEDYSVRPFSISASSIGANHQRERIWILAYSERNGLLAAEKQRSFEKTISNQSKGKNDTLNVERTSSVSETKSDVENSRRSQWPRAELRGENENETRKENANQFERSSSTSEVDVANTNDERLQRQWQSRNQFTPRFNSSRESSEEGQGTVGQGWWESEPNMGRVAHGIPKRVDRLKSLGNSLVPQIPYYIGKTILEVMNGKTN